MRKVFVASFVLVAFLSLPLFAQMAPPQPLEDDLCKWLVGEWEGATTSPMGKSQDWQKVEWGLDNQFVIIHFKSKMTEMNPEAAKAMAESMKLSKEDMDKMAQMAYKGMGPLTVNPQTGEFTGYWFDNWRGTYKGTGKREGNKITMQWEGTMGTSERTIEKVGEDKMVWTFKEKDASGNVMEGRTELTRKKMADKS
jgi:hypothetical protein